MSNHESYSERRKQTASPINSLMICTLVVAIITSFIRLNYDIYGWIPAVSLYIALVLLTLGFFSINHDYEDENVVH